MLLEASLDFQESINNIIYENAKVRYLNKLNESEDSSEKENTKTNSKIKEIFDRIISAVKKFFTETLPNLFSKIYNKCKSIITQKPVYTNKSMEVEIPVAPASSLKVSLETACKAMFKDLSSKKPRLLKDKMENRKNNFIKSMQEAQSKLNTKKSLVSDQSTRTKLLAEVESYKDAIKSLASLKESHLKMLTNSRNEALNKSKRDESDENILSATTLVNSYLSMMYQIYMTTCSKSILVLTNSIQKLFGSHGMSKEEKDK